RPQRPLARDGQGARPGLGSPALRLAAIHGPAGPADSDLHARRLVAAAPDRPRPAPAADQVPAPAVPPAPGAGPAARSGRGCQPPAASADALTARRLAGA